MIRVAAGLIHFSGLWLVAKRIPKDHMGPVWEFPGGKIEPGETPELALIRELKEELDLEVEVEGILGQAIYHYEFGPVELVGVIAEAHSDRVKLRDHSEVRWLNLSRIKDLDLAPADVPLLEMMLKVQGILQGST